ncbi:Aste57867_3616 [Aphanomyces stellatus]|uniref:Aste57867_3616 protein n=1 Tax=Aphanomyces stellatus TaxID=120398 RepID=A0A485KBR3_9STRA|nr:hypothetical protein As57867_003605 [Aphanomyces stellatus]VFT80776.1 Aste57867_3616 [Aphanomyces stellatus]
MPKLFCVVVGDEGSPFPVDVAADETVGDLKKKIKGEIMYDGRADRLELYIALKNGAWLSDEDPDLEGLSQTAEGNAVLPLYIIDERKMKATKKLSKFFSGGNYPAYCNDEKIHVLVVVPEGAVSSTSPTLANDDALLQKMEEAMERQFKKQKKRECIAFSGISSTAKLNKVINGLNVTVVSGKEPDHPKAKQVRAFEWDPSLREDQQIAEYLQYLHGHLNATLQQSGLCLLDATQFPGVLAIQDGRFEFDLNGTADVLVLNDLGEDTGNNVRHLNGLRLVMELKKDLTTDYSMKENQALAELIAANVKAPDQSPVVVLTDLRKQWEFMWLSSDFTIRKCILKKPINAFMFIRQILQSTNFLKMPTPFATSNRFPKKGNINVLFPRGEGTAIGDMIERYQSIKSEIHPLDWSMEREIGKKIVQEMPAYWGMYV